MSLDFRPEKTGPGWTAAEKCQDTMKEPLSEAPEARTRLALQPPGPTSRSREEVALHQGSCSLCTAAEAAEWGTRTLSSPQSHLLAPIHSGSHSEVLGASPVVTELQRKSGRPAATDLISVEVNPGLTLVSLARWSVHRCA